MLYSMWHASTELEGYGQQGALLCGPGSGADAKMHIPSSLPRWIRYTPTRKANCPVAIALPVSLAFRHG